MTAFCHTCGQGHPVGAACPRCSTPPDVAERLATMGPRPLSVCVADVESETVEWCWAGRVPYGKITVLDGDPGLGKSTVTLDLAARLTTGTPLPGDELTVGRLGPVAALLLSAEDGVADTIRPRLEAAGADLSRVHVMAEVPDPENGGTRPLTLPDDLGAVEAEAVRVGARLVVVDPFMAFLSGDVNAHRDSDVRRVMHALKLFAERHAVAVLVVRHLNKSGGGSAVYRGGGSIGIVAAARAGIVVAADPEDETGERRILAVTKSNLAAKPAAYAYRLVNDPEHGCASVAWEGPTAHQADDLLRIREQEDGAETDASAFLADLLSDGPVRADEVLKEARRAGHAERTLKRAKATLGVRSVKDGGRGAPWFWAVAEFKGAKPLALAALASLAPFEPATPPETPVPAGQGYESKGCQGEGPESKGCQEGIQRVPRLPTGDFEPATPPETPVPAGQGCETGGQGEGPESKGCQGCQGCQGEQGDGRSRNVTRLAKEAQHAKEGLPPGNGQGLVSHKSLLSQGEARGEASPGGPERGRPLTGDGPEDDPRCHLCGAPADGFSPAGLGLCASHLAASGTLR